jgi:hypothetical protein
LKKKAGREMFLLDVERMKIRHRIAEGCSAVSPAGDHSLYARSEGLLYGLRNIPIQSNDQKYFLGSDESVSTAPASWIRLCRPPRRGRKVGPILVAPRDSVAFLLFRYRQKPWRHRRQFASQDGPSPDVASPQQKPHASPACTRCRG